MTLQPTQILFPDVTSSLVLYLKGLMGSPYLDTYKAVYGGSPIKVAIDTTNWRRPTPLVRLSRAGGRQRGVWDEVRVQFDVLHEDMEACHDLTQLVRRAMQRAALEVDEVRHVSERMGPTWMPDADTEQPRFTWVVEVLTAGTHTTP